MISYVESKIFVTMIFYFYAFRIFVINSNIIYAFETAAEKVITVSRWATSMNKSNGRFVCPNCGKTYGHRPTLGRHLKYECGLLPQFRCYICHKAFTRKPNLKSHLGIVHHVLADPDLWSPRTDILMLYRFLVCDF